MAQHPKAKPKRKGQRNTDKKQSERFKETARVLGADISMEEFRRAFERLGKLKPKND